MKIPSIFTAIDKFTAPVRKMGEAVSRFANKSEAELARMERAWRKTGDTAFKVGRQGLFLSAALIAPLVMVTKQAIEFEDKMADVGKTTGMSGIVLEKFGEAILEMSTKTRTSINDLVKIGEIGGQLGVAENELLSFVDSANKFNVALGSDFEGGVEEAVASVSKLKSLFTGTREMNISDVITKAGSAINVLGAEGNGTSQNIVDFALSIGALPDAMKPSIESTLALGAYLEELGVDSKRGSSGVAAFIAAAGKDITAFAKQMNMSADAARELFGKDSLAFMAKFSEGFKGMSFDQLSVEMEKFGLNSLEVKKVVGALSNDTIDLTTGMTRLQTLQALSNDSFEKGTSLMEEYNAKNSTAAAKWAILKNNIQVAAITLGQAFLPVVLDLMKSITPMIQKFSKWIKENKGLVGSIMKAVAGVAAFSGGVSVLAFAFGGIAKTIAFAAKTMAFFKGSSVIATTAVKLFSASLMGIPIVAIIAGVAALAYGIYRLVKSFDKSTAAQRVNNEVQQRVLDNTADQRAEVMLLTTTLRYAEQGSAAYNETLEKLDALQPGIIEKYNLQEKSIRAINMAERELINTIMERAKAQAQQEILTEKFRQVFELEQKIKEAEDFNKNSSMSWLVKKTTGQEKIDLAKLKEDIAFLGDQIATDQIQAMNPESERQTADLENKKGQKITVDFINAPNWLNVKETGNSIGKISTLPGLSTTR
jgi:TP901 family phage tail tape measure protein